MARAGLAMCPTMMVSTMPMDIQSISARMSGRASVSMGRIWVGMDICFRAFWCGGLPQGCYCGKVFIVDTLMVDLRPSVRAEMRVRRRGMATVEDSLVKYLKFERLRLGLFSTFRFDVSRVFQGEATMAHRISRVAVLGLFFSAGLLQAQFLQIPGLGGFGGKANTAAALDDATIGSGLKEALSVGTQKAVRLVAKPGGYLDNEAI